MYHETSVRVCAYVWYSSNLERTNQSINQSITFRILINTGVYIKHIDNSTINRNQHSIHRTMISFHRYYYHWETHTSNVLGSHAFSCNCIGSAVPVRSTSLVQPALKRPEPRSLSTSTKGIMVYHRSLRQEKEDLY